MNDELNVIAVSNRKGGAGKTTVAVNLAVELGQLGLRVLLVDLDSQGHCAVGLGMSVAPGEATVHELFRDADFALSAAVRDTAYPNLAVALADQLHDHGSGLRDTSRLAQALRAGDIRARFDVVVVDTPPSLDNLLANALAAANWVLVPYVPHTLSLEGVKQLMRVLFKLMTGENPQLRILGFLPVTGAGHIRQHRIITGEMARQFGSPRILPGVRNDIRVAEAFAAGLPVRHYAPRSRAAQDFAELGARVALALA